MPLGAAIPGVVSRVARHLWIGWILNLKLLWRSRAIVATVLVQPVVFATIAFYLLNVRGDAALLSAAVGAGMMGIWSSTLYGSAAALLRLRFQGTLELVAAAPASLFVVVLTATLATATVGLYSLVATLAWGRILVGMPLDFADPPLFALAIPVTVITLGLLGVILAASYVHFVNATALTVFFEYPIWLASGMLVPVSRLPGWVEPLSWLLAPTWGVRALRAAATGGDAAFPLEMSIGVGLAYLAAGALLLRVFERFARVSGRLALA
jgi:ABC-2 type transport system permease protein